VLCGGSLVRVCVFASYTSLGDTISCVFSRARCCSRVLRVPLSGVCSVVMLDSCCSGIYLSPVCIATGLWILLLCPSGFSFSPIDNVNHVLYGSTANWRGMQVDMVCSGDGGHFRPSHSVVGGILTILTPPYQWSPMGIHITNDSQCLGIPAGILQVCNVDMVQSHEPMVCFHSNLVWDRVSVHIIDGYSQVTTIPNISTCFLIIDDHAGTNWCQQGTYDVVRVHVGDLFRFFGSPRVWDELWDWWNRSSSFLSPFLAEFFDFTIAIVLSGGSLGAIVIAVVAYVFVASRPSYSVHGGPWGVWGLYWLCLAYLVPVCHGVCTSCWGKCEGCTGTTASCPWITGVAANVAVVAGGTGTLALSKLLPVRYLRLFTSGVIRTLVSISTRPMAGTFEPSGKTLKEIRQAVVGGYLTKSDAMLELMGRLEALDVKHATYEQSKAVLTSMITLVKELNNKSIPPTVSTDGVYLYVLACLSKATCVTKPLSFDLCVEIEVDHP